MMRFVRVPDRPGFWQFFLTVASFGVPDTCDYGSFFGNCFIWRAGTLGLWQFFLTVASFSVPSSEKA
jgi:hypothetical protein